MANYNSVEEIFNAGISNMTVEINNIKYDDNSYALQAPDFLNYDTIYVNGNSWFGFGSSTEHLKVNRRNSAMYYLYSEIGAIGLTKFFKIRWSGYSYYSTTSSSYKLVYDVILWQNGDISLKMDTIPRYYNDGSYELLWNNMIYYISVSSSYPHYTFKLRGDGGFNGSNKIIEVPNPLFLIKYQNKYYTHILDEENQCLIPSLVSEDNISSEIFLTHGKSYIPFSAFENFEDYQIAMWEIKTDYTPSFTISGIPEGQWVNFESINIAENNGIVNIKIPKYNNTLLQVSPDGGQTWKHYNSGWVESLENEGMTVPTAESLTQNEWAEFSQSTNCIFRALLSDTTSSIREMYIKYNS